MGDESCFSSMQVAGSQSSVSLNSLNNYMVEPNSEFHLLLTCHKCGNVILNMQWSEGI